MAKKEIKRRFITLELNPGMSDEDELKFKEMVVQGLKDLRSTKDKTGLLFNKLVLRTEFENESDIRIVNNNIIVPR